MGKKLFTVSVVVMTIAWSMGVAALMPSTVMAETCPVLQAGDTWKVANSSAVYVLNADMESLYFPNSEVYHTWYNNFDNVQVIPSSCINLYPTPENLPVGVNYRPGSMLVKRQIQNDVYAILPGNKLARIGSPEVAEALYGANWDTKIRDLSASFWVNYSVSDTDLTTAVPHNGMVITVDGTTNYQVVDGMLYQVDGDVMGSVQTVSQ